MNEIAILIGTAVTIGFIHTVFGPDHYLPFIVISKTRHWTFTKTIIITLLCGIGHVMSSVILGFIGIALGISVFKLEPVESFRGELAAWLLIVFGFAYSIWGIRLAIRNIPHKHLHLHKNEDVHSHSHKHIGEHSHIHNSKDFGSLTPWVLFIIFLFGPCEPLIPLLMYPAAKGNIISVMIVASVFGLTTILTMLGIVLASLHGLSKLPTGKIEKYSNAFAGLIILLCGIAVMFMGI